MPVELVIATDKTEHRVDPYAPHPVPEQLAWERQFRSGFAGVYRAYGEVSRARDEGRPLDPEADMRIEWILFFAWFRLRRQQAQVARTFAEFLDSIEDYTFEKIDDDESTGGEAAEEPDGLDPTDPGAPTAPVPQRGR